MAEIDYDKLIEPTDGVPEEIDSDPVAEPTPEPKEAKADPDADVEDEGKEGGRRNERIRQLIDERKALEARVESLEKLQQEIVKLRESMAKPEPEPEPEVDFMEDPKAYVDTNRRVLEDRIKQLEASKEQDSEQQRQELFVLKLQQSISDDERTFTSEHPDYLKALAWNRERRLEELDLMGVTGDDAGKIITQEEIFLARRNLDNGKSPAEAAYNLALKRGYKPQVVDPEDVDKDLDQEVARRQKAREAQSMGGSGVSNVDEVDEGPEQEAWEPVIQAAIEAYGERAAREMFGDLMK